LHAAEERREFKFAMLDRRDLSPVGYKRYSKETGKEVEWKDIVKGYEYDKDEYVVLSDEDFKRANVEATQTIDIRAFVPAAEIPIEYYETPYYLAPGKRGEKSYALLRETLKATNRIAVAEVVIRTKQHLAAVVPADRALMLNTMRYADELRDMKDLSLPTEGLKSLGITTKEVELAKRLVADMEEHWKPGEFKDTYHDDLMKRIEEKIKAGETKEITKPERGESAEPRSAQVIDLAALLQKSLERDGRARRLEPKRAATKATATRRAAHATAGRAREKPSPRRKRA
jgi:DNA end-binding protein Ku